MKIRPSILLFISSALFLAILMLVHKSKETQRPLAISQETNATLPNTAVSKQAVKTKIESVVTTVPTAVAATIVDKGEQIKEGLGKLNDENIFFYGKVVDQFTNPIPDAVVSFGVRIYNGFESTVKSGQVISDANGLFTISGYKGESLGLGVKKEGYALVSMKGSGIYSHMWPESQRAHPDKNNPTVIEMWKLHGAEQLISFDKNYKLHYTNTIDIDFISGEIVQSGGDIKIKVNRPTGEVSEHNMQDWGFEIDAVDGGLIETPDKEWGTAYEAPAERYEPNYRFFFSTNAPYKWFGGHAYALFVKSRNGQVYSKIGLTFDINSKPDNWMYIRFSGVANTNSSRNWEATAPQQ